MEQRSSCFLKYQQQKSVVDEQQQLVNNQQPSLPLRKGCPRCNSSNTKFCYFNNYKISQPRYFCRECKRYWTQGGLLRDLPIGGTARKERTPTKRATSRSNWGRHLYPVVSTAVSSLQSTHTKPGQLNTFPDVSMAGGTFIPDNGISSAFPFKQPEVPRFDLAGGFKIPPFGSQQQQVFRLTRQMLSVDQSQFPSANSATSSVSPIGLIDGINASTKRETSRSNRRRNLYPAVSTAFSSRLQSTEPGRVNAIPGVSMAGGSTFIPGCGISSAFPFQQPEVPRFNLAGGLEITPFGSQLQQQQLFHSTRKLLAVDQSQNLFARNSATPSVSPVGFNDGGNAFVPEDGVLSGNNMEMDGFQGNPYSCFP